MKTLRLPLKKKWFEMTKAGIKTEEYRELSYYWRLRLIDNVTLYALSNYVEKNIPFKEIGVDLNLRNATLECLQRDIVLKKFDTTTLTLGYPSNSDKERIIEFEQLSISIGHGKEEWGAEKDKLYFVIKHGKRLN